jgi:signal transduction histidine kinase
MTRALKIISCHQHQEPGASVESAPGRISTEISPPRPETRGTVKAGFDLSPPFGLSSGRRQAQREQTPKEEKKARSLCLEKRIALETMNKLMLTISHYLSNPLTVLLGKVELLAEATENGGMLKEDVKKFTDSCKREIHKIDSIIKVFQNLCELRYKTYPPGIKMLDVEKEIKDRLKEVEVFDIIIGNKKE